MKKQIILLLFLSMFLVISAEGRNESTQLTGPVEISIVGQAKPNWGGAEDNLLFKYIEEKANVKMVWEIPPTTNYDTRLNLIMASGDMPDLLWSAINNNYWNWVESGLVLSVDKYLPETNFISQVVSDTLFNNVKSTEDGKLYGIPRPNPIFLTGMVWRKDWLDALGMDIPVTLEECEKAWKAFRESDFDGNGKEDTYGFTMYYDMHLTENALFPALGINGSDKTGGEWILDSRGNVTHQLLLPNALDGYKYLANLYGQGVIEREFLLNKKVEEIEQKINQGLIGSGFFDISNATWTRIVQKTEEVHPGAELVFSAAPKTVKGQGGFVDPANNWGVWLISAGSKHPNEVIKFLDLMHSPEMWFAQSTGISGVHYESYDSENERVTRTEEQAAQWAKDYNPRVWFTRRPDGEAGFYARSISYRSKDFAKAFSYNNRKDLYYPSVNYGYYPPSLKKLDEAMPSWRDDVSDIAVRIVLGEDGMDDVYKDLVSRIRSAGLDQAIDEVQDYYNKLK